jgi:DNA polymerase III epsilon subunit-like protein
MSAPVVFVDTETTGLDPERHEVWEVAIIAEREVLDARIKPKALREADPGALRITRFYERVAEVGAGAFFAQRSRTEIARDIAELTANKHLVGAVPSFDARFLEAFLRSEGFTPAWHYHLVDVETLAAGRFGLKPPWDSDAVSAALGIEPPANQHVAMADAEWARALYTAVLGDPFAKDDLNDLPF